MNLPPELITFVSAMLPVTELRLAIPVALQVFEMSPVSAFSYAVIGNFIPVLFLLLLYEPVTKFLMERSTFFDKLISKIFDKTRHKHTEKFNKYGALFLIFFVAIPLPGSGGWTGSMIAYLFGVPLKYSLLLISIGLICSGLIVTLGFESITSIIDLIRA